MADKKIIFTSIFLLAIVFFFIFSVHSASAYGGGSCNVSADCTDYPGPAQCYTAQCITGVCYYNFNDTTGPSVSSLSVDPHYNNGEFNVTATVSDVCSFIKTAEYWVGSSSNVKCRSPGTGKTIYPADDGQFNLDKKTEFLLDDDGYYKNDGQNGVCLRSQDEKGNWGECKCTYFETDSVPPERILHVKINNVSDPHELLVCGDNPTISAKVCDSESDIQGGEFFLDMLIPPQDIPAPWTGYWLHVVRQYMDNGWHCADIEGNITGNVHQPDFSQLSDGTHYLNQIRGKDIVENWGKIWNQNLNFSFIKDTTAPHTTKTLLPKDGKKIGCGYEGAMGHLLTNGCYFVKNGTEIVLNAQDPDPQGTGEFAGNVRIHYIIWWKNNSHDSWIKLEEGQSDVNSGLNITLNQDSYHLVEYWAEDGCGNEEHHHYELDIVDTQAPKTTKKVGEPKIPGQNGVDWYINRETTISLVCRDLNPHPVGRARLYWKMWWKYDENSNWTLVDAGSTHEWEKPLKDFSDLNGSYHKFEYWCVDGLGNEEEHHFEIDVVDNQAPEINKTVGEPQAKRCDGWGCWPNSVAGAIPNPQLYPYNVFDGAVYITQNTPITLTCKDKLPHPVDNVSIHYMVLWKERRNDNWTIDKSWTTVNGEEYNFTYDKDSLHVLYYYCEDSLGNEGPVHKELDIVDTRKPGIKKRIFGEKVLMNQSCDPQKEVCDYWVTQNSSIYLRCKDFGPHPVDNVTLYWRWGRTGNLSSWAMDKRGYVYIHPREDCMHELQWYCVDELGNSAGSRENPFVEKDNVDTQGPNVTSKYIKVKKYGQSSFGDAIYGNESNPVTVAIRGEDTIKLCANVHDYKQTGDEGVGVLKVFYNFKGLPDPRMQWDSSENAWCVTLNGSDIRRGIGECGKWEVRVRGIDKLHNVGEWKDGLQVIVDNVPPVGEVLNPHAGSYYRDGKSFQIYAPAVDFGGDKCCLPGGFCGLFGGHGGRLCNQNCPASGVDYCDFYAIDYNFEGMNQSEIKNCYRDLWKYFDQLHANPKVVYLGRVPYENGVCKGKLTIPKNSGLTDTVFLGVRYVDKAGNDGINLDFLGKKYNLELALNPWFSPITMNMDNEGPLVMIKDSNLPGPVTTGQNVRIKAEIDEWASGFNGNCWANIYTDDNGSLGRDTGLKLYGSGSGNTCDISDGLPEGLESGNYWVVVKATDNNLNAGNASILMIVDNTRPTMKIVSPKKGEVYGNMFPVSLHVEDSQSPIVDDMVRFRVREIGGFGNVWCLGGCEETPWLTLTKQNNGLYAGTFNLSAYGISGSGKYTFDAIVCDSLYDTSNVDVNGIPIIGEGRNGHHCTKISIHGADEEKRTQCNDGIDNDRDGYIDYPSDSGCDSPLDDDEMSRVVDKLVINEFLSNPAENGSEWIELYNAGNSVVSLDQYSILDGNNNTLAMLSGTLIVHGFYAFNISGSKLNNNGDLIKLLKGTELVDSVSYGNWDDGNLADNAPAPEFGESVGRCPDGKDTDVDSDDFKGMNSTRSYSNHCAD